ncbi:MAG: heme ABC exporter ATP-binding protein CcmA [Thermoflexales bacterium]|nr:heme ABC exporter ATP-binding protein CcmA [Thermoflexales bacterium]
MLKRLSIVITAKALTKQFGPFRALRGIDLDIKPGEFVTIVGPNGAGKTTLLRILATLSRPTDGHVSIAGHALPKGADAARRQIGLLSHQPLLYGDLTAEENLRFFGRMYDVPNLEARIVEQLDRVDLLDRKADRARTFSRGMQQRLAIARALLHDPSVVLLDEPFTGLDPHASDRLEELLHTLNNGQRSVVMTIHDLERGWAMCNRALVLARGKIVYEARTTEVDVATFRSEFRRVTQ